MLASVNSDTETGFAKMHKAMLQLVLNNNFLIILGYDLGY